LTFLLFNELLLLVFFFWRSNCKVCLPQLASLLGQLNKLHFFFIKGIVHFEIDFWYVLACLKGIQDVGVFVSAVVSILIFLGQTVLVYQSYNGGLW